MTTTTISETQAPTARPDATSCDGERGSALVVAVLVSVIMALLGISFLLTSETESKISRNEKLAGQALYVAESGARVVKSWFDGPGAAFGFPAPAVVDRSLRSIVDESDPLDPTKETAADGVIGSFPYYKQQVDIDSDGSDDLFDRPYRGSMLHSLRGTEDGPDLRIDDGTPGPARDYLAQLSASLLTNFPWEGGLRRARISRIDVYAPPYTQVGLNWHRYGMATVKVIARIYQGTQTDPYDRVVAEREIQTVLSEAPYYGPFGPLHSCSELTFTRNGTNVGAHWGAITAERGAKLSGPPFDDVPNGLPRYFPGTPRVDLLWDFSDPTIIDSFLASYGAPAPGLEVEDPWFRMLTGEELEGAPVDVQPYPGDPSTNCCDQSHIVHNYPLVSCPGYDYDVWKTIAGSGERNVHYFRWDGSGGFQENGMGPSASFESLTNGGEGVYFFDTRDGLAPYDNDGNGSFDNLTPDISITNSGWFFRGFLFVNAESFKLEVDPGLSRAVTFNAPGEPFQDADQDGRYDGGEAVVYLDYPTALSGPIRLRNPSPGPARTARGPDVPANASFHGILYTNGSFEATGGGNLYGSLIARQGVVQTIDDGSAPTPDLYWDESIATAWPPDGWDVPRVTVTRWITDR